MEVEKDTESSPGTVTPELEARWGALGSLMKNTIMLTLMKVLETEHVMSALCVVYEDKDTKKVHVAALGNNDGSKQELMNILALCLENLVMSRKPLIEGRLSQHKVN